MAQQNAESHLNSSSVYFKTHEVRLGTPIVKTLADLSASGFPFQAIPPTNPTDSPTHWVVWPPADNSETVGYLYARNDLIVGVEHRLSKQETLTDVYDSLFNALSDMSKDRSTTCSIRTFQPNNISNGTVTQISFACGGITISVDHADFKDQQGKVTNTYEVTETIGVIN
jgi:hypothetical protein